MNMYERDALSDVFQDGFLEVYLLMVASTANINITLGINKRMRGCTSGIS